MSIASKFIALLPEIVVVKPLGRILANDRFQLLGQNVGGLFHPNAFGGLGIPGVDAVHKDPILFDAHLQDKDREQGDIPWMAKANGPRGKRAGAPRNEQTTLLADPNVRSPGMPTIFPSIRAWLATNRCDRSRLDGDHLDVVSGETFGPVLHDGCLFPGVDQGIEPFFFGWSA